MRDYKNNPLKKNEAPSYEDLYELYIIRNMSKKEVGKYIGKVTYVKYLDIYGIKKPKSSISNCRRDTNNERYGVDNISQIQEIKDKKQQTSLEHYGTNSPVQNEIIKRKIINYRNNKIYPLDENRGLYAKDIVKKYWEREWNKIKQIEFPPTREYIITDEECLKEVYSLKQGFKNNKASSKTIVKYHSSLKYANKKGCLSPYDYWQLLKQDSELFKKFYENRLKCSDWFKEKKGANWHYFSEGFVPDFIYGIGLSTSRKAPMVSYFKPALAKNLITQYLNNYDTIFDPCSGYSGRLIGSLCSGKSYIGYDINDRTIDESKQLYNFIKPLFKSDVELYVKDSLSEKGRYDCLFTCTPYNNFEEWRNSKNEKISSNMSCDEWIDKLIKNFDCKRYLFVTDEDIIRYKSCIVEVLENNSHFGSNVEYVVVVDKL